MWWGVAGGARLGELDRVCGADAHSYVISVHRHDDAVGEDHLHLRDVNGGVNGGVDGGVNGGANRACVSAAAGGSNGEGHGRT